MILDPEIQKLIGTAVVSWLWAKYGQLVIEKVGREVVDPVRWRFEVEKYYTSLYEKVGFVHVLGQEPQPLEALFTDVNILDRLTAKTRYSVAELDQQFTHTYRRWHNDKRVKRMSGGEVLANYDKLFLFGKPGAGKTTFLKWCANEAIAHRVKKFPIFVTLNEMANDNPNLRRWEEVQAYILKGAVFCLTEAEKFVPTLLEKGGCLVLFDGLDEVNVADEQRAHLIQAVNQFVHQYPSNQFVISCRVAATDYSFTQFEYVEMADFSETQITTFVQKWFAGDTPKGEACQKELQANQMLGELAQTPLLLTLLCLTYEERNEFPARRADIYDEAVRALLSKWDAQRNIRRKPTAYKALAIEQKRQLLTMVAAHSFDQGKLIIHRDDIVALLAQFLPYFAVVQGEQIDGESVLNEIAEQHGLLVERARRLWSFSHLTLQEYFTAKYIVDQRESSLLKQLMPHLGEDRWREVLLLVAQLLADGTEFVQIALQTVQAWVANDPTLCQLLAWAERKGASYALPYKPHAMRAFALSIGGPSIDLNLACELDSTLAHGLDPDLVDKLDPNLDLDFDVYFLLRFGNNTNEKAREIVVEIPQLILKKEREKKDVQWQGVVEGLSQLEAELPHDIGDEEAWANWWERLQALLICERDIGHDWQLSDEQKEVFDRYWRANDVLAQCLQTLTMKPQMRQRVEQEMLQIVAPSPMLKP